MDQPFCYCKYFVHRHGFRSFRNNRQLSLVLKYSDNSTKYTQELLRLVTKSSILHITETIQMDFQRFFEDLQKNLKLYEAKTTHQNYLRNIKTLEAVDKLLVARMCKKAFHVIIPKITSDNFQKIIEKIIHKIIFSFRREHIILEQYIDQIKMDGVIFNYMPLEKKKHILYQLIHWMLINILPSIVLLNFYVTTTRFDGDDNKLYFFNKRQWQSYSSATIQYLIRSETIKKKDEFSIGSKVKKKHSMLDRIRIKSENKVLPKLQIVPKPNDKFRLIAQYNFKSLSQKEKIQSKNQKDFLKLIKEKPGSSLETQYQFLYNQWLQHERPKLYFIKADLSDAFGSVDIKKLIKIIGERHLAYQRQNTNIILKRKAAQQYNILMKCLNSPFLVRWGSTVYEWTKGLIQGQTNSPALSDIYYNHHDNLYFCDVLANCQSSIHLFVRIVDDYLFITENLSYAVEFLNALSKYDNLNSSKTIINFIHPKARYSSELTFLGYKYDTSSLEVARSENFYAGQVCFKIAFTFAINNPYRFIECRLGSSYISTIIFNLNLHTMSTIWKHIFEVFCYSANRFCTMLAVLSDEEGMPSFLSIFKKKISVKMVNRIIKLLVSTKPKDFEFNFCINHYRYLSFKALELCAKSTPKCSALMPSIKILLLKTNCMSGKWKHHAKCIDSNGLAVKDAEKEICRKHEIKKLITSFDKFPKVFQCYQSKR